MGSMTVRRVISVLVASCWLLASSPIVDSIPLPEFFPFGPNNGDLSLLKSDDASQRVMLEAPIPFYGLSRDYITVRCK